MDGITTSNSAVSVDTLRNLNGINRAVISSQGQEFDNLLSQTEQAATDEQVRGANLALEHDGRQIKQVMDKDDYLKLLITQLQNQDPTSPMDDKEFIAQMAQFSSLEQMTNMTAGFQAMSKMLAVGQATSMLGREVEISVGGNAVRGVVQEVTRGDYPQVLVNGTYYDIDDIARVRDVASGGAAVQGAAADQAGRE